MKHLFAVLIATATGIGYSLPSHAAEGLVCSAVVRGDPVGPPVPLHNGTRFNCGPQIQSKTIPELSAAGWIIVHVHTAFIAPDQIAWQLVIQK